MLANDQISYLPYDDYAQSANTLFHFMTKQEYLDSILRRRAIIPRYCIETIDYLNIHNDTRVFNEAAILQKCFCDIPFHKLADSFAVNGVGDVYESLSRMSGQTLKRTTPILHIMENTQSPFRKVGAKESIFSRFTILTKTPNMQKIFLLYSNAFFRMMTFRKSILKMYSTV